MCLHLGGKTIHTNLGHPLYFPGIYSGHGNKTSKGAILLWQSFGRHQFHRLGRKYVWYYILPFSSQICTMLFLMFNFGFSNKLMGYTLFVLYTHFALLFTNMFGIIYSVCPSLHK